MERKPEIDDLIKKVILEEGLDKPSVEFADKVMSAVMHESATVNVYKPLIPKSILAAIVFILLAVIGFALTKGDQTQAGYIPYFNKIVNNINLSHFSFGIPAEISYILTSALIMILIQAFVIRSFYKRMHR